MRSLRVLLAGAVLSACAPLARAAYSSTTPFSATTCNKPVDVFIAATGTIYTTCEQDSSVVIYTPTTGSSFSTTTVTSTGAACTNPQQVRVDTATGSLYVSCAGSNTLMLFTKSGSMWSAAALNPSGTPCNNASGVFVDSANAPYASCPSSNIVYKYTGLTLQATAMPDAGVTCTSPQDLWGDAAGNIYVACAGEGYIKKWTPASGSYTATAIGAAGSLPAASALIGDTKGNLFATSASTNAIVFYNASASYATTTLPASPACNGPSALTLDASNNLFASCSTSNYVMQYAFSATSGTWTATTMANGAACNNANYLQADTKGNVYAACYADNSIHMYSPGACSVSAPVNGTLGTCSALQLAGSNCSLACDAGFTLAASPALSSCSATGSVFTAQTCIQTCTISAPPASGTMGTCTNQLLEGQTCQFACNASFLLSGFTTKCASGALNPAQSCVAQTAPLINTVNGLISALIIPSSPAQSLTIVGTGFVPGSTSVTVGGAVCAHNQQITSTQIICTAPATTATSATVLVVTVGSATASVTIFYQNAPTITSVNPTQVVAYQALTLTLTGTNYVSGSTAVTFNGAACTLGFYNTTYLTCTVAASAVTLIGTNNVVVTTYGSSFMTATTTVQVGVAPTLTSVKPNMALLNTTATVTLTGANFTAGVTTVSFGPSITLSGAALAFTGTTQIVATVPPVLTKQLVDVTVTTAPLSTSGFTFLFGNPTGFAGDWLGCYDDTTPNWPQGQLLPPFGITSYNKSQFGPTSCYDVAQAGRYLFYGVKNGGECWAGNTLPTVTSTNCNLMCSPVSTNPTLNCGGANEFQLYNNSKLWTPPTTLPPTTLPPTTGSPTTPSPTTLPATTAAPTTPSPTTLAPTTQAGCGVGLLVTPSGGNGVLATAKSAGTSALAKTQAWESVAGGVPVTSTPAIGSFLPTSSFQISVANPVTVIVFDITTNQYTGQMQYRWYPDYPCAGQSSAAYTCDPCAGSTMSSCNTATGPGSSPSPSAGFPCASFTRRYTLSGLKASILGAPGSVVNAFSVQLFDLPPADVSSYSFIITRAANAIVGDPMIYGLQGQSFQVHGEPDQVFNIITAPQLQVNSRFVYLSSARCLDNVTACFAHPGTYMGELGVRLTGAADADDVRVSIRAHSYEQGLTVKLNGKHLKASHSHDKHVVVDLNDAAHSKLVLQGHRRVVLQTALMTVAITNSDLFMNVESELRDEKILARGRSKSHSDDDLLPLHGLQGQTWRLAEHASGLDYEGSIQDYQLESGDLFGTDFVFNKFQVRRAD